MNPTRNITIDLLRGFAVVLMTLLHVGSYYGYDAPGMFSWDYLQFIVPLFVFCSAYVDLSRSQQAFNLARLIKRVKRLIIPFWIFAILFFSMNALLGKGVSFGSFVQYALLLRLNVIDFDWMVFLFISLALMSQVIQFARKYTALYWVLLVVAIGGSIVLFYFPHTAPYRLVMWTGWMIFMLEVDVYLRSTSRFRTATIMIISSVGLFFLMRIFLNLTGNQLRLYAHKYPPDLYFISYGTFWIFTLYITFDRWVKKYVPAYLHSILTFFSRYSYSFYLVHIFFLFAGQKIHLVWGVNVWEVFIFVLAGTSSMVFIFSKINNIFKRAQTLPVFYK